MCTNLTEHMESARRAIENEEYFDFAESITSALHLSEKDEEVLMLYVCGLMEFRDFKKALAVIEDLILRSGEECNDLLQKKAIILCRMGDFDSAKTFYEELCESEVIEKKILGYSNLASMYLERYLSEGMAEEESVNEAIINAYRALNLIRGYDYWELQEEVLLNLGGALWYNQSFSDALNTFKQALHLSGGKNYLALIGMAEAYISLEIFDSALESIEKAELLCLSDSYQQGQIKLTQAKLYYECLGDLAQARENIMVAYDNFVQVDALYESWYCIKLSLYLDYIINSEAIGLNMSKLNPHMTDVGMRGIKHWRPWGEIGKLYLGYNKEVSLC